jgi:hypothetical protein
MVLPDVLSAEGKLLGTRRPICRCHGVDLYPHAWISHTPGESGHFLNEWLWSVLQSQVVYGADPAILILRPDLSELTLSQ